VHFVTRRSLRAKHLRLRILPTGEPEVVLPRGGTQAQAAAMVRAHTVWITRQQQRIAARRAANPELLADSREHFLQHKTAAEQELLPRLARWAAQLKLHPQRATIKRLRSRWGSCSARGNISLSYKLLFLSPAVRDYVIVHELCHLRELNHSARFWALVAAVLPEWRELRQELRVG